MWQEDEYVCKCVSETEIERGRGKERERERELCALKIENLRVCVRVVDRE